MWIQFGLRKRIYFILVGLVLITLMGGIVMTSYTYRMEHLLNSIITKHLSGLMAAEALEVALVNQKGFVSYYFIDGDPDWLRQLGKYRQIFKERLVEAMATAQTQREKKTITLLESEY